MSSGRECGVRGESHRFHLREFRYDLCRSCNESPRCLLPHQDVEVGGECGGGFEPRSGLEDGFEGHTQLLYKHAKKCFAVLKAVEIMGVPDQVVGRLPEASKEGLKSMLGGTAWLGSRFSRVKSPSVSRSLGGGESTVRSGSGGFTLLHKDGGVSRWNGSFCESVGGITTYLMRH